ncbi:MAG: HD domain-containing protein [Candidatus Sericytochromatia bacterium]|nr:HD domain-containing protein [Candidatus Sericytochromatia bacterium]
MTDAPTPPNAWLQDCRGLLGKYRAHAEHAEKVARLADGLFTVTRDFNGLADVDRVPLVAGALLHDLGQVVGEAGHHRHGAWLVAHDEALATWPEALRGDVAWLVLNHRKRKVRGERGLKAAGRDRLWRLAAILRLADVLDRAHDQRAAIHEVVVDAAEARVTFTLSGVDLEALGAALPRKARWAAEAWDAELVFRCDASWVGVTPGGACDG